MARLIGEWSQIKAQCTLLQGVTHMDNKIEYEHQVGINWVRFTHLKSKEVTHLHRYETNRGANQVKELLTRSILETI